MYQAEGFSFETKEEAEQAKKEGDGIRYLKAKTKMEDPEAMLHLYCSLIERKLFETEVGLRFLFELQEKLEAVPYIKKEDIVPIPARKADGSFTGDSPQKKELPKKNTKKEKGKSYRKAFHVTLFLSIIFGVTIIGMFIITYATGNSTNIVNYENEIINKYESWENELEERQAELDAREGKLNEQD